MPAIEIPDFCVVALVGASGSGKSTFAKKHFKPTEVLSSDFFRGLISDDENDQSVSGEAFAALYHVANKRLDLKRLTVIDATNVQKEARAEVLKLARDQDCHAIAIVLNVPEKVCLARNALRPDRDFGNHVVRRHVDQLRRSIRGLQREGFRYVFVLDGEEAINATQITRQPLWNDRRDDCGPFDIIGDIHGCYQELLTLLQKLGYQVNAENFTVTPPEGRKLIFLGDLCDRGPENVKVLRLVMNAVKAGHALAVVGNHDYKLLNALKGKQVTPSHGLQQTLDELANESEAFRAEVKEFLHTLISHYVLDNGKLVVAHAGLKEKYQGRGSGRVKQFCMFGETNGETDEYGLPVRLPWAKDYHGKALVVFGHTPTPQAQFANNTICIDTGCVFGGKLTALRYPEQELVQVEALKEYYRPLRPLTEKVDDDDMLDLNDVLRQRYLSTRLRANIKIHEDNAMAALELMSRFAIDPHWLIYLPPTMSPCQTSQLENCLEYPSEAFDYYKTHGVGKVICEQKHMGSRAVIVLCKDAEAARQRFKTSDGKRGVIYTRTGRSFFEDEASEAALLERLDQALTRSGFWNDFATDWVCLDCELMPWSAKAQQLLEDQYAGVGRAGRTGLAAAIAAINAAHERLTAAGGAEPVDVKPGSSSRSADLEQLLAFYQQRHAMLNLYTDAYRRYCWEVNSLDDYRIAPFHILASENKNWSQENHLTHLQTIERYISGTDPLFIATPYRVVDLLDDHSIAAATAWWEELTEAGNEGMVVKPIDFIAKQSNELLQPAIKCRGREYLRIIYGPEYTLPANLTRLRRRGMARKQQLALNEFALGMEAIERFVNKEPLYRVHQCVFAVLAMESEPVDPRL